MHDGERRRRSRKERSVKRNEIRILSVLGLALSLSACGGEPQARKKEINRVPVPESSFKPVELEQTIGNLVEAIGETEPTSLRLGIVLKTLTGYWEPVKLGANRALAELEVSGVVVAPTEATDEERTSRQLEILEEQRLSGYDGFGVAPMATVIGEQIDAAVDSGIPVVTIDSDLAGSARHLYVGTINYEAGKTAGETLLGLLEGPPGTVILLGHDTEDDWPDGYGRTQGAKDVLEASGYTVLVRRTTWTDTGEAEDIEALEELLTTADPPAVGMIGLFSPVVRCAKAAETAGLGKDDIVIVGFDFEPETLSYMRSGLVRATHAQRQYYMGYLVPYVLYSLNVLGLDETLALIAPQMADDSRFNAGLDVVHADQIEEYTAFLASLGIGG